jgi:molecular chaperone HscA
MQNLIQIQDNTKSDKVVGIDFGTTFSLVAYSKNYKPKIIADNNGNELIPSVVTFLSSSEYLVGEKSFFESVSTENTGENNLIQIKSIKRLLGKTFDEAIGSSFVSENLKKLMVKDDNILKLRIYEKLLTPVEIASLIFSKIKLQIDNYFEHENVNKAVITVPAYFDDKAKNDVKNAAKISGIDVIRIISEPTSAGYAYSIEKKDLKSYMVFDFGGGTFDVSIIKVNNGLIQVVATSGDANLGGDDVDMAFASYLKHKYNDAFEGANLLSIAKKMKEEFSEEFSEKEDVYFGHNKINISEFNEAIKPIIKKTITISKNVYEESKSALNSKIESIILVGGSSKIKFLQNALIEEFNLPLNNSIDQEKVVAFGAAMYAENLSGTRENLLLDVVPLSFGIETFGGAAEKIIHRNSPVPTYSSKYFTNYVDNQTAIVINILQGERDIASELRSVGKIEIEIERAKAGAAKIEVVFYVSEDGILEVKVIDSKTGKFKEVQINTNESLKQDEINKMILDSFYNAEQDINEKNAIETRNKASVLLKNVRFILSEMKKIDSNNSEIEYISIDKLVDNLAKSLENDELLEASETIKKIENDHKDIFEFYMQNKVNSILNKTKIY